MSPFVSFVSFFSSPSLIEHSNSSVVIRTTTVSAHFISPSYIFLFLFSLSLALFNHNTAKPGFGVFDYSNCTLEHNQFVSDGGGDIFYSSGLHYLSSHSLTHSLSLSIYLSLLHSDGTLKDQSYHEHTLSPLSPGSTLAMEVDLNDTSHPHNRTLRFFVDGNEQPVILRNLAECIIFCVCISPSLLSSLSSYVPLLHFCINILLSSLSITSFLHNYILNVYFFRSPLLSLPFSVPTHRETRRCSIHQPPMPLLSFASSFFLFS